MMISSGILLSYAVDLGILAAMGGRWRMMLGAAALPSLVMMAGVFSLVESPRWLVGKGRIEEGRKALEKLRKTTAVDQEFQEILSASAKESAAGDEDSSAAASSASIKELLSHGPSSRKLVVCVFLQAFQQVCGINAIVYFTPLILREAGVSKLTGKVLTNPEAASMLSTIVAYAPKIPALLVASKLMDRMGRKKLLTTFTPIMGASLVTLASCFRWLEPGNPVRAAFAVLSIMTYGVVFCMSLGPIPSILSSEIFASRYRSAGMSASVFAQWTFNALVTLCFPVLQHKIGTENVLWIFAAMCAAATIFSKLLVPETKGMSLEELGNE